MSDNLNLEALLEFTISLARKAGEMITASSLERGSSVMGAGSDASKKNRVDLVTATDQAVEVFVRAQIAQAYPGYGFIGEESDAGGEVSVFSDKGTFVVDPIDGTTNFVHGFPECCISLGFCLGRTPTVGVIFNPFHDRLYTAIVGGGSFVNGKRLPLCQDPQPLASLGDALIGIEWGSDRGAEVMRRKVLSFSRLAGDGTEIPGGVMAHSLRSIGSAALNYCYVAQGSLDLYWEVGPKSWDVAAGIVIAREAGAKVYGRGGKALQDAEIDQGHFCVIRAIASSATETGSQAQDRIASEFFAAIQDWDL